LRSWFMVWSPGCVSTCAQSDDQECRNRRTPDIGRETFHLFGTRASWPLMKKPLFLYNDVGFVGTRPRHPSGSPATAEVRFFFLRSDERYVNAWWKLGARCCNGSAGCSPGVRTGGADGASRFLSLTSSVRASRIEETVVGFRFRSPWAACDDTSFKTWSATAPAVARLVPGE